jgi:hypothetical protein
MSATATAPAPTRTPDPDPAGAGKPSRVERLLDLVRKLIDYGKDLATTLRQCGTATDLAAIVRPFGTRDITLILARITHGLLLAGALEARLVQGVARLDAERSGSAAPRAQPTPRAARAASCPADPANSRLASLPTPEQIAAEVRRRPIGAVIADICRDLGIMPTHPLWGDLSPVILRHGGNLAKLWKEILALLRPRYSPDRPPAWTAPPQRSPVPATGPP